MKRWSVLAAAVCLILCTLTLSAAAVNTTKEPTSGKTVYVAGNPDLYPVEYYNPKTDAYEGMLPQLYAELSETTGIQFSYIRAGALNQQSRLAKNLQVELVSAHIRGTVPQLQEQYVLLSFDIDGEKTDVCVGFTSIADESMCNAVINRLNAISHEELLSLSLQVASSRKQENSLWLVISIAVLSVATVVLIAVLIHGRVQRKKASQDVLVDSVTGLGNEDYLEKTYCFAVTPNTYTLYYICYFSIDHQQMDNYWGEEKTEEIQLFAANALASNLADSDFVARIGRCTFAAALLCPSHQEACTRTGELLRAMNCFDSAITDDNRTCFRAGIFQLSTANTPLETALLNAKHGYNSAVQSKSPWTLANDQMLKDKAAKNRLERKLSDAVKNNEIQLYLQFIADAKTGNLIGAEALSRWQTAEDGLLSPSHYIEAMREAGMLDQLDFFVLEEACKQLESWSTTDKKHLWISCNFARTTVSCGDFLERFDAILHRYHFNKHSLVIELTEDTLADNQAVAYQNILACKNRGFTIALDDLGNGYSSISDLCDYPVDIIKIDRHIVTKSATDRGNALLQGIIKMAHGLNIRVLCEGVETEKEKEKVILAGSDYVQGFHYSRVLPQSEAEAFYAQYQSL